MADPITTLPAPTKNILELDDAAAFDGSEYSEVVQGGNSRKFKPVPQTDAELLGAPTASSPDFGDDSNRIATTEWARDELDALGVTPDTVGAPTDWTLTTRTQLDQDGKVALFIIAGWTEPVGAPERWNYELRYTKDGVDPDSRIVGNTSAKIRVESGSTYVFRVRTLSKDDKSDWLVFDPITPLKKTVVPPSPTGLTANGQHKRVVLRWEDPRVINTDFYDYHSTWIYRATSNNYLVATKIDEVAGTLFIDDNRPNDTDYWYWIVHVDTSRNQSNKFPSSNTAGEHAKTNRITDDDTDDDAPGVPTNLVLTPRVERTDDGNLEVNLIITWDEPAGGLHDKGEYVVHITESTTGDIHTAVTDANDRKLKYRGVRTQRTYDVKVRARKGGGKKSDWTSTVQVTIAKKADYNTAVPSGLTAVTEHKRNILNWDELTGIDALDHKYTKIYRSATNDFTAATVVGRIRDSAFIDGKVANAQSFWYWIAHVDRSMNEGPRHPAGPSTTNGVSPGAAPRILEGDTDQTAPSVPAGLALVQTTVDVDEDGKTDIAVKATWNAATGAKDFELEITQGSDVTYVKAKGRSHIFKAKSNKLYSVKVAGISFNETQSAFSSAVTITPVKKSATVVAPTSLAATVKLKGIRLRWSASTEADYKQTNIYRHTADVIGSAVLIDSVKGTSFTDHDALVAGTTYYYWVSHVDTSGNISAKYPAVNGTSAAYALVLDADTDQTAPSVPAGLALVQTTVDVDEDGKTDIAVKATWNAATGAKDFELEITQGSDVTYVKAKGRSHIFRAKSNKLYSVKVAGISFNETQSAFSSAVTITPVKKSATVVAPTALAAVVKLKGIRLRWSASTEADYKQTNIYRHTADVIGSAVLIDSVKGTAFTDHDALVAGTTYYYWVSHVDTSGNISAKYPAVNGTSAVYGLVLDADVDQTAPGTPTSLAVVQLTKDTDGGDGRVRINGRATWNAPAGGVTVRRYVIEVDDGENVEYLYTTAARRAVKIKDMVVGRTYNVKVSAESIAGVEGTQTAAVALTPTAKTAAPGDPTSVAIVVKAKQNRIKWTAPSDRDIAGYNVYFNSVNNSGAATLLDFTDSTKYDDTTERTAGDDCYYWVQSINRSGVVGATRVAASNNPVDARVLVDTDLDQTPPSTPAAPTLAQVTVDVDEDGKTDIAVKVTWAAATGAADYELEITQGADVSYVKTKSRSHIFRAKSNKLYSVKVAANSFNGIQSAFSTATTITPVKKSATVVAPTSLAATVKLKGIRLRWSASTEADYKQTNIYRHTADVIGSAVLIDSVKGTSFTDHDALVAGTTYYYWVSHVDTSGNISAKYPAVNGTSAVYGLVLDADTDQTALGAPTGLALNQSTKLVDEDGKIDIGILATWSALTGAKSYELEVTEAGTLLDNIRAANLKKKFQALSNRLYSVRIRGLSFNGTPGAWSSAVTLTPTKKSATVVAPTSLAATVKLKGIRLRWSRSTESDYKESIIYRHTADVIGSAVEIDRVKGTSFTDHDALVAGTTYYYWVAHVDTSDNLSAKYPAVNGVSAAYALVLDADTDQTAPSTPGAPTLAQVTVEVEEDGKTDIGVKATWSAATGAKDYELEITQGSDVSYVKTKSRSHIFKAKSNKLYSVKVAANSFNGTQSAFSTATTITPVKKSAAVTAPTTLVATVKLKGTRLRWSRSTEADYKETIIYRHTADVIGSAVEIDRVKGTSFTDHDALVAGTTYYYWVSHADLSGNISAKYPAVNGVTAVYGLVLDADVDQTAPGTPTSLAFAQLTKDTDAGDGRIRINGRATWSAPASGVAVRRYIIEVDDGENTEYLYTTAARRAVKIKDMVVGRTYTVKVSAESISGVEGAQTAGVGLTPTAKTTAPADPTSVAIVVKPKFNRIKWTKPADKDLLGFNVYYHTANSSGAATLLDFVDGTKYDDTTERTAATVCYYWVESVNRSGVVGATRVAASNNPVSARGAQGADIEAGTVSVTNMILADFNNRMENPHFGEGNKGWVLSTGVSIVTADAANAYVGTNYLLFGVGATGIAARNANIFPVVPGEKYLFQVWAKATGTLSHNITPRIRFMTADKSTLVSAVNNTAITPADAAYTLKEVEVTVPATAVYAWMDFNPAATLTVGSAYVGLVYVRRRDAAELVVAGGITDAKNDQTAPGTPTSLAVALLTKDTDGGDGRIRQNARVTWSAPASGVAVRRYIIEVDDGEAGVTTEYHYTSAARRAIKLKDLVVGRTYTVKVSAESFSGVEGAQTAGVAVTPTAKTVAPGNVTSVAIVVKPKMNRIKWTAPADKDIAGYNVYFNSTNNSAAATLLDRVDATKYDDTIERAAGDDCYYWIETVNRSGVVSSARTAASNNPVDARVIVAGDTDATVLAAPTGLALALNYADIDGDGIVDTTYKATWNPVAGAVQYALEIQRNTVVGGGTFVVVEKIITDQPFASFKALVGFAYTAQVWPISFNGTLGTSSGLIPPSTITAKAITLSTPTGFAFNLFPTGIMIEWDMPTDKDYDYTEIESSYTGLAPWTPRTAVKGSWWTDLEPIYNRTTVTSSGLYYRIRHVDKRGNKTAYATSGSGEHAEGITYLNVKNQGLSDQDEAYTAGAYGAFGNSQQTIQSVTVAHESGADFVFLIASFRNTTGAQRQFDIEISSGAGIHTTQNSVILNDNQIGFIFGTAVNPGGASTTFDLKVTVATGASNNVNNRRLVAVTHKR